ncbi:AraC-type DNA-binding protein [Paenibacillus sp. UNCCL117]|uniref:AraC family transcriptional regulator n=1 Tax=unclassified Paenibacillus TaxID=185978 RepID=UPI000890BA65|nr:MULTISPECIES: AraC family transcriptional regulator [unclassified Paenibacillus]SDD38856.1 AraC-type DNA-binding protein [Paenibacillus sp. cl123]SFW48493.1 AraC-type DNA-binding protein [Paenibacillus sp. UNCCL117]
MSDAQISSFGSMSDPLYVEYAKRSTPFSMTDNHFHPYYEIYYMRSGERIYFIKDSSYPIQQGDLVFINKYELHKTLQAGSGGHERVILHFDDRFVHSVCDQQSKLLLSPFHQDSPVIRLPADDQEVIESHMDRLEAELAEQPIGYELYVRHAAVDLLLLASRFLQKHAPVELAYATPMHKKISEIVRFLNVHYAEPIHLHMLSERFFVSPYYLSRMFKEVTGFALTDYLNLTRVREAQRQLRETDLKIIDVAASVGFDNFSHFGKTFKKITRTSARSYRMAERKKR